MVSLRGKHTYMHIKKYKFSNKQYDTYVPICVKAPTALSMDFVCLIFSLKEYFQIIKFKTWLKENPNIVIGGSILSAVGIEIQQRRKNSCFNLLFRKSIKSMLIPTFW